MVGHYWFCRRAFSCQVLVNDTEDRALHFAKRKGELAAAQRYLTRKGILCFGIESVAVALSVCFLQHRRMSLTSSWLYFIDAPSASVEPYTVM